MGRLTVGQLSYVRIKLRVTQALQASGIVNSSEVFGGDAGDADNGKDNTWRYHVPSVADNNSNLYVSKVACAYDSAATTCAPLASSYVAGSPTAPTITYRISYFNTGNATQSNVVLSEILPCQSASASSVKVGTVTGPLAALISVPYTTRTTSAGNCTTTPQTRATVTFATMASMGPMAGGQMIVNVPSSASALGDDVINSARLTSNEVPAGSISNAVTFVGSSGSPTLVVSKRVLQPSGTAGGTIQYVIVVKNAGTGPAKGLQIDDVLPGNGDANVNAATRFNFISLDAVTSTGLTTATALLTSTGTVAASALTPYASQTGAANQIDLLFNFGAASTLAANGVVTLTFTAGIGSGVPASSTPYYNNVVARATVGSTYRIDSGAAAPVLVTGALSLSKTLVCYIDGAGGCVAPLANAVAANARLRYQIAYANLSASALANPVVTDTLPCQVSTLSGSPTITITAVVGPLAATGPTIAVSSGNCPSLRQTVVLGSAASLSAGSSGTFTVELRLSTPSTTPTTSTTVTNDASMGATGAGTASAAVAALVTSQPVLQVSKSVSPSAVAPGATLSYTITVTNAGTTAAQAISLYDVLPTGTSTTADASRRFTYQPGSTIVSGALTSVTPTTQLVPNLSGFTGSAYAANQQQVSWLFAGQSLAAGASATLRFTAIVGASLSALAPPNYYYNYAVASASNASQATSNPSASNVTLVANLSVTKSNGASSLRSGGSTAYTVTVSNLGPSAADNAVIKDVPGAGLSCTSVTCAATSGSALCPGALPIGTPRAYGVTNFFAGGEAIPSLPANSSVSFQVLCSITASGQ